MYGGGGSDINEVSSKLGIPVEFLAEAEGFNTPDEVEIYPDNVQTVSIFCDMMTQWRVGPAGAIGLDYKALPTVLSIRRIKVAGRAEIFDGLQVMERAALTTMRENSER